MSDEGTPVEAEQPTEAPVARLRAEVGYFDGTIHSVSFNEGANIQSLIDGANLSFGKGQALTDEDGESFESTALAQAGKTYYISGNYSQGK